MKSASAAGFSLIELAITILVLGIVLAFGIPAFSNFSGSYNLKGATENIGAQLRLAREKAISTGIAQTLWFKKSKCAGSDYCVDNGGGPDPKWNLPNGINYKNGSGFQDTYTMGKDGRWNTSGMVIVQDIRGNRDTVSVQMSGLVIN